MAQAQTLESKYGLTSLELQEAINARFRCKVAVEGAVAEVHMEKCIAACVGKSIERYETHDIDGHPDFSIWLPDGRLLYAECKNVRDNKAGTEGFHKGGKIVAYKVETQKTRAAKADPTSRYYSVELFQILGVCLGKKTGNWADLLFIRTIDLTPMKGYSHKLATIQRMPLPDASDLRPWYADFSELIQHIDDPPYEAALSN